MKIVDRPRVINVKIKIGIKNNGRLGLLVEGLVEDDAVVQSRQNNAARAAEDERI
jgi:hypothetical protein